VCVCDGNVQGYEQYSAGRYHSALMYYERAALMGVEIGQANTAWLYAIGYARKSFLSLFFG
jgi:hypothetical protein